MNKRWAIMLLIVVLIFAVPLIFEYIMSLRHDILEKLNVIKPKITTKTPRDTEEVIG